MALVVVAAGCSAGRSARPSVAVFGDRLTVVSSAPLSGTLKASGEALINGERLALSDAGGMVGPFIVGLEALNSVQGSGELPSVPQVAANARIAIQDGTAIAYIGDYDAASTAISLPLTNQGGILQISTDEGYSGFTSDRYAAAGEPERFFPSGRSSFGRLLPNELLEARAQAQLQRQQRCAATFIISDSSTFGASQQQALADQLKREKIALAGSASIDATPQTSRAAADKALKSGADCVYYGGPGDLMGASLLDLVNAVGGNRKLFAGRRTANSALLGALSASTQRSLLVVSPEAASKAFEARYRARFGSSPGVAGLYGYEAMAVILDSIRRAGVDGNNRDSVISAFRATKDRRSVLGTYSVSAAGESSLSRFTVWTVRSGRLVESPSLTAAANG